MTPAYVVDSPELVNLIRNSVETWASHAITTIIRNAGITPSTLRVAGMDMIPAPIMLVETLKMAPVRDARFSGNGDSSSGKSGASAPVAADDMVSSRFTIFLVVLRI